ncbi:MAG: MarR family transcriptional regulator [Erysipelotrichaceae bacterium]|nr:MarR family transcriptional regulator [Erysipelotrichaceae bacterium]
MKKEEPTHLFGNLMRKHDYLLHLACQKYGIYRGQHHILRTLMKYPGLTQHELAQKTNIAKASITTSLNRMEKNGFVARKKSQTDGRCNIIFITQKGVEAIQGCEKEIDKIKKALFSELNEEEVESFNHIVVKLIQGLDHIDN